MPTQLRQCPCCADRACQACGTALVVDPLPARPSRRPALSAA
jgi:hypothetical protein